LLQKQENESIGKISEFNYRNPHDHIYHYYHFHHWLIKNDMKERKMKNIMIYAIDRTIYIQSNELMQNVQVDLSAEDGDINKSISINKSCYERLITNAPAGKFKVKVIDGKQVIEKQISIIK